MEFSTGFNLRLINICKWGRDFAAIILIALEYTDEIYRISVKFWYHKISYFKTMYVYFFLVLDFFSGLAYFAASASKKLFDS